VRWIARIAPALLLAMLAAGNVRAAIQVLDLHHRTAAQLIPSLQGVVDQGVVLRADGYRLIVRGSDAQIETVRTLVQKLDSAPGNLLIQVRRTDGATTERRGVQGGVEAHSGGGLHGNVSVYRSSGAESGSQTQSVRAVAGRPVHIDSGGVLLLRDEFAARGGRGGAAYGSKVHPVAVPNGFDATATVSGDEVTIAIRVDRVSVADGGSDRLDRNSVETTVSGHLGEWLPVGTVSNRRQTSDRAIVRRSSDADTTTTTLELRVERAGER